MMNNDCAVLFCSFDKNYARWPITAYFFQKYWPDCPFKVYLGANGIDQSSHVPKAWHYINLGEDISWFQSLSAYLEAISTQHVLVMVDDTALIDFVNNAAVQEVFNFMKSMNAVMCRLNPRPGPDSMCTNCIGRINVAGNVPYVASWTNVIWDKQFLIKLLALGYNAWEFEIKAGKSSLAMQRANDFYACKMPIIRYRHFVEKNKFDPMIKKMLAREGVKVDFSGLEFLSAQEVRALRFSACLGKLQSLIPGKYRNKIRKWFGFREL